MLKWRFCTHAETMDNASWVISNMAVTTMLTFFVIVDSTLKEYSIIMLIYHRRNMQVRFIMILRVRVYSFLSYLTFHDKVQSIHVSKYILSGPVDSGKSHFLISKIEIFLMYREIYTYTYICDHQTAYIAYWHLYCVKNEVILTQIPYSGAVALVTDSIVAVLCVLQFPWDYVLWFNQSQWQWRK